MPANCPGIGRIHRVGFKVGEYKNQRNFARGRVLTFRGVEVRKCGCQVFSRMQQLIELVEANPRQSVFTWSAAKSCWFVGGGSDAR